MKTNDILHGFRILRVRAFAETGGTLYEMEYEKNGAKLCYLARPDENKTFAIAFKTVPTDDSGVFHILEHSVLCGSKKYPVKEPFVALLKGSMQTFLNAFTFPDKTMYPVSSRVEKDFHNLMDVYMDAVLHPAILSRPEIFLQEGFHLTTEEDGTHGASGVVYNEMKGAYSSPEDVLGQYMTALLYPDTCYGHDSGGDPGAILNLTYEEFLRAHETFYHPSQALIFLDGDMDIDAALAHLDTFLSQYERSARPVPDIKAQPPRGHREKTHYYEVTPDENDDAAKARLALGYLSFAFDKKEKLIALSVLSDVLCGSNEAPLKKALLDGGLCEDVSLYSYDGIRDASMILEARGAKEENLKKIEKTVREVFESAARELDTERLTAALNQIEFRHREKDFGSYPRGLIYAMSAMESWLYGGDPAQNLTLNETLASLREALHTDFYKDLVREVFLENPHTATVYLLPDPDLAKKRAAEEKRGIEALLERMGEDGERIVREKEEKLKKWQDTPDSAEGLASLPALALSDIPKEPSFTDTEVIDMDGVRLLYHPVATDGILYADAFFEIPEVTKEDLPLLTLLCQSLGAMDTKKYTALKLQNRIKAHLGAMHFSLDFVGESDPSKARAYIRMHLSLLPSQKEEALAIAEEVLYFTRFDKEKVQNLLKQTKLAYEEHILSAGHTAALGRVFATVSLPDAMTEYASGYEAYLFIKALDAEFESKWSFISEKFNAYCKQFFIKERAFTVLTGERDVAFIKSMISVLSSGKRPSEKAASLPLLPKMREGIATAARVAYAVQGGRLPDYTPAALVLRHLLSYEYLWSEIRVKNGAYGAGLVHRKNANTAFYSYRDPSPEASIGIYGGCEDFVKAFTAECEDLTDVIIGTLGAADPLLSAHMKGDAATADYLRGRTKEDRIAFRKALLTIDKAAILAEAKRLVSMLSDASVSIIGAREKLEAAKAAGQVDTVLDFGCAKAIR